ncbi:hypothetical protein ACS3SW_16175 [Roseobacteraceae bacterium S113]
MTKKKRRQKKKQSNDRQSEERRQLKVDGGGFDWGWPAFGLISANQEFPRRMMRGGFVGCGYGLVSENGPPFIALTGDNVSEMKKALDLMREWVDEAGPSAVTVEILFDDPGYVISVSQQPDIMRWRLMGLDTTFNPITFTVSVIKRLDTRHPFLSELAEYSRKPVAPVWLTVAGTPPNSRARRGSLSTQGFQPLLKDAILLPGIDVYTHPDERPPSSTIVLESELPEKKSSPPPQPDTDPISLYRNREKRLLASMPKTMLKLRHSNAGQQIIKEFSQKNFPEWQVEQALCNLRLRDFLPYEPKSAVKKLALIDELRTDIVENATTPLDLASFDQEAICNQIKSDAGYLLRRLKPDVAVPESVEECLTTIKELGYG